MKELLLPMALLMVGAAACADPGEANAERRLPLSPAREEGTRAVALRFEARVNQAPFACGSPAKASAVEIEPTDLRLFVHDVRLVTEAGNEVPLQLDEDGTWQSGGIALLDFEDGTGACQNGTAATRTVILGKVKEGSYTGVRFRIGVPFDKNHGNPATATGPLGLLSMHWGWQAGYKFLRLGLKAPSGSYRVHLGSTGCEGTVGHISRCARDNRPAVSLSPLDASEQRIVLDVGRLLRNVDFTRREVADGCMESPDDPGCAEVFSGLGLDLSTGRAAASAEVFHGE